MRRKIYYENRYTDSKGVEWLVINGDTHYNLNAWSAENAREEYMSEEAAIEADIAFRRANGFYD